MTPHAVRLSEYISGAGIPLFDAEFFIGKHQEHDACKNPYDCKLDLLPVD